MSKRILTFLTCITLSATATYYVGLHAYPKIIMNVVMDRLSAEGKVINTLRQVAPVTPETQRVVRPSPDLLYATCVYDLSDGDVEITVAESENYYSLSLYQNNTDNFFVKNDKTMRGAIRTFALTQNTKANQVGNTIVSPSAKGIALIRRLATNDAEFDNVIESRKLDSCQLI